MMTMVCVTNLAVQSVAEKVGADVQMVGWRIGRTSQVESVKVPT